MDSVLPGPYRYESDLHKVAYRDKILTIKTQEVSLNLFKIFIPYHGGIDGASCMK